MIKRTACFIQGSGRYNHPVPLHVSNAASISLFLFFILHFSFPIYSADFVATLDSSDGSSAFVFNDSGDNTVISLDSNGNVQIKGGMRLDTSGIKCTTAETLIVDGKIGVGIISPVESLDINGALRISTASGTNDGTIRYTGTDFEGRKSGAWVSLTQSGGDFSNGGDTASADRTIGNINSFDLGFLTDGQNRLHIQNDGMIGVGNTSPSSALDISGSVEISGNAVLSGALKGSVRAYQESTDVSSTSSSTYQTKTSIDLGPGTWIIFFIHEGYSTLSSAYYRLYNTTDSTPVIDEYTTTSTSYLQFFRMKLLTIPSGTKTIAAQYHGAVFGTCYIRSVILLAIRFD